MERGYIKLWRAIWDNKYWPTKRAFTRLEAWADLLMLASYKDRSFEVRGVWVSLERGQVGRSVKGLSHKWKWSPGKVGRFLKTLKADRQIDYQTTNVTTLITIINYDMYQGDGDQNGDQTDTKQIPDGDQTDTYNKDKKLKKEKNTEAPRDFTSYFPTDWQEHLKFMEWCNKWEELRKKKRWPRNKLTYSAQAEKLLEYDIDTAIRALRDSIQSEWQGVFPKAKKVVAKGDTISDQKETRTRQLNSDINDAKQGLQYAKDELEFKPKPTSKQRVKAAETELAKLQAELKGMEG